VVAGLRQILTGCGFTRLELFGLYPALKEEGRYAVIDETENALLQLWPSDRPGGYWMAGLKNLDGKTGETTLDYRNVPCGAGAIQQGLRMFLGRDPEWWAIASPGMFPKHPWVKGGSWMGMPDPEDVGVPGVAQFLLEFPFAEPLKFADNIVISLNGEAYKFGPSIVVSLKEEPAHAYTEAPRKIEL
jgi:hypothetical protein